MSDIKCHLFAWSPFPEWSSHCKVVYNEGEEEYFLERIRPVLLELGGRVEKRFVEEDAYLIETLKQWNELKKMAKNLKEITLTCRPFDRKYLFPELKRKIRTRKLDW